jgi:hypothetical protein
VSTLVIFISLYISHHSLFGQKQFCLIRILMRLSRIAFFVCYHRRDTVCSKTLGKSN